MTSTTGHPETEVHGISFVVPAHNEQNGIAATLERLKKVLTSVDLPYEILVVDDASTDETARVVENIAYATLIPHPSNGGYGLALKSGILNAKYGWIGIVDADGSYEIEVIPELVRAMEDGFDMAIAERQNVAEHDTFLKGLSRRLYIAFIQVLVDRKVPDPNSGLRIFSKEMADGFLPFLCNSFSFTTSLTVFALGGAYFVKFVPSNYEARIGESKVRHFRDSLRTIQLIVQGVTFYNPVKLFLLLALGHIVLVGLPGLVLSPFLPWLALAYVIAASIPWVFLAIGALADIFRISTLRHVNIAEYYGGKPVILHDMPSSKPR